MLNTDDDIYLSDMKSVFRKIFWIKKGKRCKIYYFCSMVLASFWCCNAPKCRLWSRMNNTFSTVFPSLPFVYCIGLAIISYTLIRRFSFILVACDSIDVLTIISFGFSHNFVYNHITWSFWMNQAPVQWEIYSFTLKKVFICNGLLAYVCVL